MNEEIGRFLATLTGPLTPIREVAAKCLDATAKYDKRSNAFLIGHRPKVAPEAYAVVLYPGISDASMDRYCQLRSDGRLVVTIPPHVRSILRVLNGAHIYGAHLFGVPPSMLSDPPLLDRSRWQPLEIGAAAAYWQLKNPTKRSLYFFGSGEYSHTENAEYFLGPDNHVEMYLRNGRRIATYGSVEEFLVTELRRLETNYNAKLSE